MLRKIPPPRRPLIIALLLVIFGGFGVANLINVLATRYAKHEVTQNDILPVLSHAALKDAENDLYTALKLGESMAANSQVKQWMSSGIEDESAIQRYLRREKDELGFDMTFMVSLKTQNYYFASGDESGLLRTLSKTQAEDRWFFEYILREHTFDVNVSADFLVQNAMMLYINYTVYDDDGNVIGIVGCSNNLQRLVKQLGEHQYGFGSDIYIIDEVGRIQIHPATSQQVMASGTHSKTNIAELEGFKPIAAQLLREKLEFQTFTIRRNRQNKIVAARHLPELNWFLIVEQEPPASLQNLLNYTLLGAVISGLTSLIASILGYSIIVQAFREVKTSQQIDPETGLYSRTSFIENFAHVYDDMEQSKVYLLQLAYPPNQWAAKKPDIETLDNRRRIIASAFSKHFIQHARCARWRDHSFIAVFYCHSEVELGKFKQAIHTSLKNVDFNVSFYLVSTPLEWGYSLDALVTKLETEIKNRMATDSRQ